MTSENSSTEMVSSAKALFKLSLISWQSALNGATMTAMSVHLARNALLIIISVARVFPALVGI